MMRIHLRHDPQILGHIACALAVFLSMISSPQRVAAQNKVEVIERINEAEMNRETGLAGYTVTERNQVFEPGDEPPVGQAVYKVTYVRGRGKTYQQQSLSARKAFVQKALERTVHGEEKASQPEQRKKVLLTSANYSMILIEEGKEPQPLYICNFNRAARKTRVVKITPRNHGPNLIDGFLWVDSSNYHLVRVEGRFSDSPSMWVGRPVFERDYSDLNGFAMAISSCSRSQSWLSQNLLQITYENYEFPH